MPENQRIVIAALHRVMAGRYDRYLEMFKKFFSENPNADQLVKESEIKGQIKGAIKGLQREDRIIWFLRKLRDYLANPDDMFRRKLNNTYSNLLHYVSNATENNFQSVLDYRFPPKASIDEVENELKRLEKAEEDKISDEERNVIDLEDYEDTEVTEFMTFPDGWVWHLIDAESCRLEADSMTHCGNTASPQDGDQLLSLRKKVEIKEGDDEDLEPGTYYKPYATFVINDGLLSEMKGVKNNKPGQKLHKYIVPLLLDDRVDGIGEGRYGRDKDFSLDDLPEPQKNDLLRKKPMLGGMQYFIQNHVKENGVDQKLQNLLKKAYKWEFVDDAVVIEEYKDATEFSHTLQDKDFSSAIDTIEDPTDSIFIDHVSKEDQQWIVDGFKEKHPKVFQKVVDENRENYEDDLDDDEIFREVYDSELDSAYFIASELDYEHQVYKAVTNYFEDADVQGAYFTTKDGGIWNPFELRIKLTDIDFDDLMDSQQEYELNEYYRDFPSFYLPRWDGMGYSDEDQEHAVDNFSEQIDMSTQPTPKKDLPDIGIQEA